MKLVSTVSLVLVCVFSLAVGMKDSVWGDWYGGGPVAYLSNHSKATESGRVARNAARVAQLTAALTAQEEQLAGLDGEQWAVGHVAAVLARAHLDYATNKAATGSFGAAKEALDRAEAALRAEVSDVDLKTTGGVVAGLVAGRPYLGNDKVAFVWSRGDDGGGLLSVYDRRTSHEFLQVTPTAARLWQITVKKGEGEKSYSNGEAQCIVSRQPRGLEFAWQGAMAVRVRATLNPDETVVRLRLNARPRPADEGLLTVIFPVVSGIEPLTPDAAGETTLKPKIMQFSAMIAEGQGLYFAEEDPEACSKDLIWSPQQQEGTLEFTITHPVLDWGGPKLVKDYASPGDIVIGPFLGDWYDAARLYRKWALTAPWCAKGPMYTREDYPHWLAEAPYWIFGNLNAEVSIQEQIDMCESFGLPTGVLHAYNYWCCPHMDDRYPEYFPPRLGSEGLKHAVQSLHSLGMRVVPYVNGFIWDLDTESWRTDNAEQGALRGPNGELQVWSWAGNRHAAMCPHSALWRDKLTEVSKELVGRYGMDGIYFDFLTHMTCDCYNPDHGHPIGGGNFWAKSVRGLYGQVRREIKKLNPNAMLTAEDWTEWTIDLLDTQLAFGGHGTDEPLFEAVYGDYTLLYGRPRFASIEEHGGILPYAVSRRWLDGRQLGWSDVEWTLSQALKGNPDAQKWIQHAKYYVKLLHCHYYFGRPYLAYGEMLRPPRIEGDLPLSIFGNLEPVVRGSAWKAPDGSVGIFFLNYDTEQAHEFSWTVDLQEGAGWDTNTKVRLSKWTKEEGLVHLAEVTGGELSRQETLEPWGLIALKLEAMK